MRDLPQGKQRKGFFTPSFHKSVSFSAYPLINDLDLDIVIPIHAITIVERAKREYKKYDMCFT